MDWASAVVRSIHCNIEAPSLTCSESFFGGRTIRPQLYLELRFQTFKFWASVTLVLEQELLSFLGAWFARASLDGSLAGTCDAMAPY